MAGGAASSLLRCGFLLPLAEDHRRDNVSFSKKRHNASFLMAFSLVILREIVYNNLISLYRHPDLLQKGQFDMIRIHSDQGDITVSNAVFTAITGAAATNCFGVKGMAYRTKTDGLVHLLRRESMSKGVKVTYNEDNTVSIELHIVVENGVNIATVCRSIMGEVKYVVSKNTGVEVRDVNVCVDSMNL